MNISYKRDMTHNYMVPDLAEQIYEDDYRVHMLMENHIRGLLPCSIKSVNCQSRFFYDITSRQSMEQIFGNASMDAADIRTLLHGLYRALNEVKKYLLDMDRIVLEPQMIYMDVETREPLFCYLPGFQKDIMQSFRELGAYLLEHLDRSDEQAVLLGYGVYRKAREENYPLERILKEAENTPTESENRPKEPEISYQQRDAGPRREYPWEDMSFRDTVRERPKQDHEEFGEPHAEMKKQSGRADKKTDKKGRAKQKKPPAKTTSSNRTFLIAGFCFAAALTVAAAWFWGLSTTQIGGIIFLLAGLLAYGCSLEGKKKKTEKTENEQPYDKEQPRFQEPLYYEEAPYAGEPYGREPYTREPYAGQAEPANRLGDTGVLYEDKGDYEPYLVLVSQNPHERNSIVLEKDSYIVGKLAAQSDIVVSHPSVSRIHAKIERRGREYYLCDLNSTNGTFLNGRRLAVNEHVMIHPSDEIAFARAGYHVGRC